jgi:hypothetical protein
VSISTRQVLKESFLPKSLTWARAEGTGARSHEARMPVILMAGPGRGRGGGTGQGSMLFRRISASSASGMRRNDSTTSGSKWEPAQRLISVRATSNGSAFE